MAEYQNILRSIFSISLWLCIIIFVLVKIVYLKKGRLSYFLFLVPLLSGVLVVVLDPSRVFLVVYAVPLMIALHTIYLKRQLPEKLIDNLQVAFDGSIISKIRVIDQRIYAITTDGYLLVDISSGSETTDLAELVYEMHQELVSFSPKDQSIFRKLEKTITGKIDKKP